MAAQRQGNRDGVSARQGADRRENGDHEMTGTAY